MTIHEGHPSPMMNKDGNPMSKSYEITCDFCDRQIEDGAFFEMRTCDASRTLDICTRCMAILEDEVRKRVAQMGERE